MNETAWRLLPFIFTALSLASGGCSPAPPEQPPLAGARVGGPFTLTDQNGHKVSDRQFAGKYRIVYFGFTFCPDVCPVDLQQIGAAMRLLEKSNPALAAKVVPIFISVDPERDTPAVLKQYVAAFHPRLVGLTGTREEIADAARRYGVYYKKAPTQGASGYLMDHSRIAFLMGKEGEPIAILPHEKGAAAIAAEIERWAT